MKRVEAENKRELESVVLEAGMAVVGGGMSGLCCAITAAREGVKVVLVHDRPVLGGNASSEVRLWVLGATSHMGNNNRWTREGGVINEILTENLYRDPEGNPLIFDALLLEMVAAEANITLLLNTAVYDLEKESAETVKLLHAFCSQNETRYVIKAPLFCDASGDGIVGYLAGARFQMGSEGASEFGEGFAPAQPTSHMLGHTLYFYSKDTGRPVTFIPPAFALKDITCIPRWRDIQGGDFGCKFWWLEWGGTIDTVHETENIKWRLWQVVYGVWNHIKNSGRFPEAENLTLEWVGMIPGKRESRRFVGDYMLCQRDIIEQRHHPDAVLHGGWAIDLHPADGVFSPNAPCTQWHSKGVYSIPFRCLYSQNIKNLYFAGRNISASHVAFGSTRVMGTGACAGQAVGMASAQARLPMQVDIQKLQLDLLRSGHYIPGVVREDPSDLVQSAAITASSELRLSRLEPNGENLALTQAWAMLLPMQPGPVPKIALWLTSKQETTLNVELRISQNPDNYTPETTVSRLELHLKPGDRQKIELPFVATFEEPRYVFVCLMANEAVEVALSDQRITGILAVTCAAHQAVTKSARQMPPPGSGIDSFEFWIPQRRPGGKNLAIEVSPPLVAFHPGQVANGIGRPVRQVNAWVADPMDTEPTLQLAWKVPQKISRIELVFDPDFDHPMESVFMGHPERVMPFCVRQYQIRDSHGHLLAECTGNHQSRNSIRLSNPVPTNQLFIMCMHPSAETPAALFEVHCYSE